MRGRLAQGRPPEELPVGLSAELRIRGVDRVSIEYRRLLAEIARDQLEREPSL